MKVLKEINGAVKVTESLLVKIQSLDFSSLVADGLAVPSLVTEYLDVATRYLHGRAFTSIPNDVIDQSELIKTAKSGEFRFDINLWVDGVESDLTATFYVERNDGGVSVQLYDLRVL